VANWLDDRFRHDDIALLGNGVAMVPSPMLRIAALVPPAGPAVLYVAVSGGRIDYCDDSPHWPPRRKDRPEEPDLGQEHLQRHRRFWTFDRESFEKHFPSEPENCNGHPQQQTTSEPVDLNIATASWNGVILNPTGTSPPISMIRSRGLPPPLGFGPLNRARSCSTIRSSCKNIAVTILLIVLNCVVSANSA
jgi:hypothetical protein